MDYFNFLFENKLILKEHDILPVKERYYSSHLEYYFKKETLNFNEINDFSTRVFLFAMRNDNIKSLDKIVNIVSTLKDTKDEKELHKKFIAFKELFLRDGKN